MAREIFGCALCSGEEKVDALMHAAGSKQCPRISYFRVLFREATFGSTGLQAASQPSQETETSYYR
jgi:hypothetical protein